jgi:membrane-bound lytic murein transglycosylase D
MFAHWLKRSGRYRDAIRKTFAKKGVPEDLVWLAMVESGFEPTARSPVGALGMWQFMPETGKVYGLSQDRWADQRIHVQSATEAAADFLADLYRRFGSWELAMAAYNMGYGGITQVVKKYNTNDYFALSKLEGSLPWETTLYVPKILSCAIVSKNLAKFGFAGVAIDPPIAADEVRVPSGTPLASVAQAAGVKPKEVEALNPELRAQRTPPGEPGSLYVVRVPAGKGPECAEKLAKAAGKGETADRYVVKVGESISDIAESHRVLPSKLVELNAIAPGEVLHGGTVLLVPKSDDAQKGDNKRDVTKRPERPVVVVPADVFVYPDRTRVFYKVKAGDAVDKLAETFGVTLDELRRWNTIDLRARLLEGMTLQVFVRDPKVLDQARALAEPDVDVVVSGSEAFFAHFEEKGRKRIVVSAKAGDTLEAIGKRHGVTAKLMERINRRAKDEPLREGESVVLYVPPSDPTPSRGDAGESKPLASALPPP